MGRIVRRDRNGQQGRTNQVGPPDDIIIDLTEPTPPPTIHPDLVGKERIVLVPSDPQLNYLLKGFGSEQIMTTTRNEYVGAHFDVFQIPETITTYLDRPVRPNEFPDGIDGIVPNALFAPDNRVLMFVGGDKSTPTVTIGLAWRSVAEALWEHKDPVALPEHVIDPIAPLLDARIRLAIGGFEANGFYDFVDSIRKHVAKENGIVLSNETTNGGIRELKDQINGLAKNYLSQHRMTDEDISTAREHMMSHMLLEPTTPTSTQIATRAISESVPASTSLTI